MGTRGVYGRTGPPPEPAALSRRKGNPAKKAIREAPDPGALTTGPAPPGLIGDHGRREWCRIVPILLAVRILTDADLAALAHYCASYDLWCRVQEQLNSTSVLSAGQGGVLVPNPLVRMARDAAKQCLDFAREFGLTPCARARLAGGVSGGGNSRDLEDVEEAEYFDT